MIETQYTIPCGRCAKPVTAWKSNLTTATKYVLEGRCAYCGTWLTRVVRP